MSDKPYGNYTVLVLEDHPFQRKVTTKLLQQFSDNVYEAEDGHKALALIETLGKAVDIVFCDLKMEGMDGIEFIRHAANKNLAHHIVLASSADEDIMQSVGTMTRAYGANLLGSIVKPINYENLQAIFSNLHETQQQSFKQPIRAEESFSADELRSAMARGEIVTWFQPKMDASAQKITGAEALVRWNHPERGLIPPLTFLPSIEKEGLMKVMTESVIGQSVAWLAHMRALNYELHCAINYPAGLLTDPAMVDWILKLLSTHHVPPQCLTFEITESALIQSLATSLESLTRIRLHKINISIDDFGTGYSSLQQLNSAPFNELKIDRSFVQNVDSNRRNQVIIETTMQLARDLNLTTVAEGVETQEEFNFLRNSRCDIVQGYLIAKPMPADEFQQWLSARSG